MNNRIIVLHYVSPCGELLLGSFDGKLCLCDWLVEKHHAEVCKRLQKYLCADLQEGEDDVLRLAAEQLNEYFRRERKAFDVPLLLVGTDFQKKVWEQLLTVPYGKVVSYAEQAKSLGSIDSVRAVANANGANAVSIFVPCHRVVGSDGKLTGYGGGLDAKKYLLDLESISLFR